MALYTPPKKGWDYRITAQYVLDHANKQTAPLWKPIEDMDVSELAWFLHNHGTWGEKSAVALVAKQLGHRRYAESVTNYDPELLPVRGCEPV
jgi:hypothetical protein